MEGTTFEGDLSADSMQVTTLLMRSTDANKARFKRVSLNSANVTGHVSMEGASFDGDLDAAALQVGAHLVMTSTDQHEASFKGINLSTAKIGGNVEMQGASFDGDLDAIGLQVGAYLFMRSTGQHKASFQGVNLNSAKVAGDVLMDKAVGFQQINMSFIVIGGNLDISGTSLAELDLSGASIAGDLRLGSFSGSNTPTLWREPGQLNLRNTRIGNLMDAEDAWPTEGYLNIDGFTFARIRDLPGVRSVDWWDGWVRRDPVYSPTPYEQLTAALLAAGDRDAADKARYLARVRQSETEKNWGRKIFIGFVRYVAGFGIGDYAFRVLYWVIGISAFGALFLWMWVPAAYQHGCIWCFGASLSRLLPVIEINKEFTEFFNDPNRTRLTGWQSFVFSIIAIAGWVLGAILIVAVSGLTQKP